MLRLKAAVTPSGIVVGRLQYRRRLDQVYADQQRAAGAGGMGLAQEGQRVGGGEVADAGARVEQGARPGADLGRQRQALREVEADAEHVHLRMLALQTGQRVAQKIHRDVDRYVALDAEGLEQARGLLTVAGAQIDQAINRAQRARHVLHLAAENGGLGARRVVLGQLGDGGEQA
jgi:hypothetical protein